MRKKPILEGSRVVAPYKGHRELKVGRIEDNLNTMWFVKFADGTEDFIDKRDSELRLEEIPDG